MHRSNIFIATVAIVAIFTGSWLSYQLVSPDPVPATATILPAPVDVAEFSLMDQHGNTFDRPALAGHWNLLFFGFTHCPDICPVTLQLLVSVRQSLAADGQEPIPRIVLISVDPERDTPGIIGQYVGHFGQDIIGVTGDLDELRKLTNGLGIFFEKTQIENDNYSVDHSAAVIVVNPESQFHALFGAPHEIDNFVHDLPIITASR